MPEDFLVACCISFLPCFVLDDILTIAVGSCPSKHTNSAGLTGVGAPVNPFRKCHFLFKSWSRRKNETSSGVWRQHLKHAASALFVETLPTSDAVDPLHVSASRFL